MEQLVDKAGLSADENDQPWMRSLYSTSPGMVVLGHANKHLNTRTARTVIRFRTGNQCNSRSIGDIWSYFLAPVTRLRSVAKTLN